MSPFNRSPLHKNAWHGLMTPRYTSSPRNLFLDKPQFLYTGRLTRRWGWNFGAVSVGSIRRFDWACCAVGICVGVIVMGDLFARILVAARGTQGAAAKVVFVPFSLALNDDGVIFRRMTTELARVGVLMPRLHAKCRSSFVPLRSASAFRRWQVTW
jgi:hypothetical protein